MLRARKVAVRFQDNVAKTTTTGTISAPLRRLQRVQRPQSLKVDRRIIRRFSVTRGSGYEQADTFHRAIKPYIFIANVFGVMPLVNVLSPNPDKVTFRISSAGMVSTILFFVFGGYKSIFFMMRIIEKGINAKNVAGIVYYNIVIVICMNFVNLARRWPRLIRYWTRMEMIFLLPPYNETANNKTLKSKFCLVTGAFTIIGLLEFGLFNANSYYNYSMRIIICTPTNDSLINFRDFIINERYGDIFSLAPYNVFTAFYAIFNHVTFQFIWNFLDVFIILVSLALAKRFQQLAHRVEQFQGNFVPDAVWHNVRMHHVQICELIETVDEHLSTLVFISSMNNMYFICYQLLNVFTKLRWPINYVYFWVSLGFLLLRSISVFMCGSKIHDASLLPLNTLYLVPGPAWSVEAQRFRSQICDVTIGLTGRGFFVVTRKALFGLIATIVTYELVLLQLDTHNRKQDLPNLCD